MQFCLLKKWKFNFIISNISMVYISSNKDFMYGPPINYVGNTDKGVGFTKCLRLDHLEYIITILQWFSRLSLCNIVDIWLTPSPLIFNVICVWPLRAFILCVLWLYDSASFRIELRTLVTSTILVWSFMRFLKV